MASNQRLTSSFTNDSNSVLDYVSLNSIFSDVGVFWEVQKKLFSPFFTTKEHGTGLGLSMVQKIIAAHGGQIEIKSDPAQARMGLGPQGTRVIIRIPTN